MPAPAVAHALASARQRMRMRNGGSRNGQRCPLPVTMMMMRQPGKLPAQALFQLVSLLVLGTQLDGSSGGGVGDRLFLSPEAAQVLLDPGSTAPVEVSLSLPGGDETATLVARVANRGGDTVIWRGNLGGHLSPVTLALAADGTTVQYSGSDEQGPYVLRQAEGAGPSRRRTQLERVGASQRPYQTMPGFPRASASSPETITSSTRRRQQEQQLQQHRRQLQSAVPLTVDQKVALATAHNNARCAVGVASLQWNGTDAQSAASAAARCRFEHSASGDRGGRAETIYAVSFHQEAGTVAADAMADWLAQAASYDCASNSCSDSCAQYTALVSGAATDFGCALSLCSAGSPFAARFGAGWGLFVCHYSPVALAGGERPFPEAQCSNASICHDNGTATDTAAVSAGILGAGGGGGGGGANGTANGTACDDSPDDGGQIDLLVLYTAAALEENDGLVYNLLLKAEVAVDELNLGLANSELALRVNLSAVELLADMPAGASASAQSILADLQASGEVRGRRDYWRADLVALFVGQAELSGGVAMQLSTAAGRTEDEAAFCVVDHVSAANFGLARLIGHNLGCETNARSAVRAPLDTYAYGYLSIDTAPYFRTIMGSAAGCPAGAGCPLLSFFSSPRNVSINGTVAALGSADRADCARAINLTRGVVANYRPSSSCAESVPAAGAATLSGRQTAPTRACPNNCNNHGSCDYTTFVCYCRLPWFNSDVSLDCSLKKCPNNCGGNGECDTSSGVCMCNGGWTGVSCSSRVKDYCPNDCSDSLRRSDGAATWTPAGGTCNSGTGGCNCRRVYTDDTGTWTTGSTELCASKEGDCYHGSDWSTRVEAARVEWRIGEVGTATTGDGRASRPVETESGWTTVALVGSYTNPVVIIGPPVRGILRPNWPCLCLVFPL
eukprot:SAG22_NODE_18_length_32591_cov_38.043549_28_plen_904_part_00